MTCVTNRIRAAATSISWIPSEAISGLSKLPFRSGTAHYDDPPPDSLGDEGDLTTSLERLRDADRFRFANHLWVQVDFDDDGGVIDADYLGGGMIGSTTIRLGKNATTVAAVAMDDIRAEPEIGPGRVRFVQSAGGRTGVPAPRTVRHPPFVQFHAPTAWTTLSLTVHSDGRVEQELVGASPFPRHWIYDTAGELVAKSGLIDFKEWYKRAFGKHTPWGNLDSPGFATQVESALERELSLQLMRGGVKPRIRKLKTGELLASQGQLGSDLYVLLDGVLSVSVDGQAVAEVGPGSILGERALLEGGQRTSTLTALTPAKVAVASSADIEPSRLAELAEGHRREDRAR